MSKNSEENSGGHEKDAGSQGLFGGNRMMVLVLAVIFVVSALQTFQLAGAMNSITELKSTTGNFAGISSGANSQASAFGPAGPAGGSLPSPVQTLPTQVGGC